MSPWWSRPTADDLPEDALEDDETLDEEEPAPAAAKSPKDRGRRTAKPAREAPAERQSAESSESQGGEAVGRRRPRRRRSARQGSESADEKEATARQGKSRGASGNGGGGKAEKSQKPEKKDARRDKTTAADASAPEPEREEGAPQRESRRRPRRSGARVEAEEPEAVGLEEERSSVRRAARAGNGDRSESPEESLGVSFEISPADISREIVVSLPEQRSQSVNDERKIALFCDLENVALGVRDSGDVNKFDIHLVLERLLEKGKIIVKKAYCDWERYHEYKRAFHEAAIELIDIPQKYYSGKNSADIKMVVDAMDLSYSKEHLDTFVLLSGDSDFSPLVSKLKENNKYVIGVGVKNSSSNLLIDNCDEFLYYEDIWRDSQQIPQLDGLSKKAAEAFSLMVDAIQALVRENKDVLWGSMIKQTMQRKKPSFNEGYYGYGSFSELLEDAAKHDIVKLKKDQRSGSYIVTGFASQQKKKK